MGWSTRRHLSPHALTILLRPCIPGGRNGLFRSHLINIIDIAATISALDRLDHSKMLGLIETISVRWKVNVEYLVVHQIFDLPKIISTRNSIFIVA